MGFDANGHRGKFQGVTTLADLEPAARTMAKLVEGVPDGPLDGPTPCPAYRLGDLLDHIRTLALAFTAAATKETEGIGHLPPSGDATRLGDDWRTQMPRDLATLASAWSAPEAWTGMTQVGGADLPGEAAGVIALDELVVHAWDLARSTGQGYEVDPASLAVVHGWVADLTAPEHSAMRSRIFGPVVDVADEASLVDRVVGLTGRDPVWAPVR